MTGPELFKLLNTTGVWQGIGQAVKTFRADDSYLTWKSSFSLMPMVEAAGYPVAVSSGAEHASDKSHDEHSTTSVKTEGSLEDLLLSLSDKAKFYDQLNKFTKLS
jgi:hypothetical protein